MRSSYIYEKNEVFFHVTNNLRLSSMLEMSTLLMIQVWLRLALSSKRGVRVAVACGNKNNSALA